MSRLRLIGTRTFTVVALLVAFELVLKHAFGYGWWTVNEKSERYGWVMLPDQDARSRDLTVEERINSLGFRDREWAPPHRGPDGAWARDERLFRVAVLGNSMTFGTSVPIEQVFSRDLEDLLNAELQRRSDTRTALVMNFAVQGYCLEQSARVYEDIVRPWVPDLLVVPLHPQDVQPMKPAVDDAEWGLRRYVMRTATYDLLLRNVINRWMPPVPLNAEARKLVKEWEGIEDSLKQRPFAKDNHAYFEQAGKRLDQVLEEARADDTRLALVYLPAWRKHFQPEVRNADTYFGPWATRHEGEVLQANPWPEFERLMKPVVEEIFAKGMPGGTTYDLTTLSWTDAQGQVHRGDELETGSQSLHLLDDLGHLTAKGHAVVAQSIFDAVMQAGLLDRTAR
jgi:hypothetical protein